MAIQLLHWCFTRRGETEAQREEREFIAELADDSDFLNEESNQIFSNMKTCAEKGKVALLHHYKIGDEAMQDLFRHFDRNTICLQLNLSHNIISDEGVGFCAHSLRKNSTLLELNLSYNKIGDEGMERLGDAISKNTCLMELQICENDFEDVGANYIAEALKTNHILTSLVMGDARVGDKTAASLGAALMTNNTLTRLDLFNCRIHDPGALALAEGLIQRIDLNDEHIELLNLGKNYITDKGGLDLMKYVGKSKKIKMLELYKNRLTDVSMDAFIEHLEHNTSLTQVNIGGNNISKPAIKKFYSAMTKYQKREKDPSKLQYINTYQCDEWGELDPEAQESFDKWLQAQKAAAEAEKLGKKIKVEVPCDKCKKETKKLPRTPWPEWICNGCEKSTLTQNDVCYACDTVDACDFAYCAACYEKNASLIRQQKIQEQLEGKGAEPVDVLCEVCDKKCTMQKPHPWPAWSCNKCEKGGLTQEDPLYACETCNDCDYGMCKACFLQAETALRIMQMGEKKDEEEEEKKKEMTYADIIPTDKELADMKYDALVKVARKLNLQNAPGFDNDQQSRQTLKAIRDSMELVIEDVDVDEVSFSDEDGDVMSFKVSDDEDAIIYSLNGDPRPPSKVLVFHFPWRILQMPDIQKQFMLPLGQMTKLLAGLRCLINKAGVESNMKSKLMQVPAGTAGAKKLGTMRARVRAEKSRAEAAEKYADLIGSDADLQKMNFDALLEIAAKLGKKNMPGFENDGQSRQTLSAVRDAVELVLDDVETECVEFSDEDGDRMSFTISDEGDAIIYSLNDEPRPPSKQLLFWFPWCFLKLEDIGKQFSLPKEQLKELLSGLRYMCVKAGIKHNIDVVMEVQAGVPGSQKLGSAAARREEQDGEDKGKEKKGKDDEDDDEEKEESDDDDDDEESEPKEDPALIIPSDEELQKMQLFELRKLADRCGFSGAPGFASEEQCCGTLAVIRDAEEVFVPEMENVPDDFEVSFKDEDGDLMSFKPNEDNDAVIYSLNGKARPPTRTVLFYFPWRMLQFPDIEKQFQVPPEAIKDILVGMFHLAETKTDVQNNLTRVMLVPPGTPGAQKRGTAKAAAAAGLDGGGGDL